MHNKKGLIIGIFLVVIIAVAFCVIIFSNNKFYSVSFDSDGGSFIPLQEIKKGGQAKRPENPIRDGYSFLGWEYENQEYDFTRIVDKDITLKAIWEKKENEETRDSKLYAIVDGEEFDIYGVNDEQDKKILSKRKTISFDYPQFNINTNEIGVVNNKVKEVYDGVYKEIINLPIYNGDNHCVAIRRNNDYYGSIHIPFVSYDISDKDSYLSIVIVTYSYTECAGASYNYDGYVINKNTQEIMGNQEIAKLYNCSEKLIVDTYNQNALDENIKVKSIDEVQVYIYQEQLAIIKPGGAYDSLLVYKNGQFKEIEI